MRTTLNLPDTLLDRAKKILGYTSKTDTVVFSLRELVRRKQIEELKNMAGHIRLHLDLPKSRRRPLS